MENKSLIIIIVIISFIVLGCSDQKSSTAFNDQFEFISSKIKSSHDKLITRVEETGYSPAGKKFIEISESVTNKTQELINRVNRGAIPQKQDISDLIASTRYKYDTIPVDSVFIYHSLDAFKHTHDKEVFKMSLLLFNSDLIHNIRELFDGYFQEVDYLKPVAIAKSFEIKKGEIFQGTAISQAKMVAVKYVYELDDPQTMEGYVELPSKASNDYDGIIQIKGVETGIHNIKLKSTHWQNGKQVTFENNFELKVRE